MSIVVQYLSIFVNIRYCGGGWKGGEAENDRAGIEIWVGHTKILYKNPTYYTKPQLKRIQQSPNGLHGTHKIIKNFKILNKSSN